MTVQVPSNDKSGTVAKQATIATLAAVSTTAPGYSQAQQRLNQEQCELVQCLLDQRALVASTIISTLPVSAAAQRGNPLYAAITAASARVTALGAGPTAPAAAATLDSLQRQLVIEEMASGARTAASIISGLSFMGGAR